MAAMTKVDQNFKKLHQTLLTFNNLLFRYVVMWMWARWSMFDLWSYVDLDQLYKVKCVFNVFGRKLEKII